jgi:hypothetical protein
MVHNPRRALLEYIFLNDPRPITLTQSLPGAICYGSENVEVFLDVDAIGTRNRCRDITF